jgi:hypothetical protein
MSSAVFSIAATTCVPLKLGFAESSSAATAAACGAASEVPKKLGKLSLSAPLSWPKNVVLPPSGAVSFGCWRVIGAMEFPESSKRIGVPPALDYDSTDAGSSPKAGV